MFLAALRGASVKPGPWAGENGDKRRVGPQPRAAAFADGGKHCRWADGENTPAGAVPIVAAPDEVPARRAIPAGENHAGCRISAQNPSAIAGGGGCPPAARRPGCRVSIGRQRDMAPREASWLLFAFSSWLPSSQRPFLPRRRLLLRPRPRLLLRPRRRRLLRHRRPCLRRRPRRISKPPYGCVRRCRCPKIWRN